MLASAFEYRGPFFTMRYGAGLLLEVAGFAQDEGSRQQFVFRPEERLRDFRFVLIGKLLPRWERSLTWSAGIMYDSPNHQWLMRQTEVMIAVPELPGELLQSLRSCNIPVGVVAVGAGAEGDRFNHPSRGGSEVLYMLFVRQAHF